MISGRDRHEEEEAVREELERRPGAQPLDRVRNDDAGQDHRELVDRDEAEHDEVHAQGHDQRVDLEHPDADSGHESGGGRGEERDDDRDDRALAVHEGRHDEGGHRGNGADRQVDAAGQHRQRLAAGQDRQRDRGAERHADPLGRDDAGLHELQDDDEPDQEADERDESAGRGTGAATRPPSATGCGQPAPELGSRRGRRHVWPVTPGPSASPGSCRTSRPRSGSRPGPRSRGWG